MKTILTIPGPIINGQQRFAKITITNHKTTASVRWDIAGIDIDHDTSEAFSKHCQQAGMMDALRDWWTDNKPKFGPRAFQQYSTRW